MLPKVSVGRTHANILANLDSYRLLISDESFEETVALARGLSGVRICHINSTASGGGVAELLARQVPVLQGLGIAADWRLIHGSPEFFTVTKAFHKALQGAEFHLRGSEQSLYTFRRTRRAPGCWRNNMTSSSCTTRSRPPSAISAARGTRSGSGGATSTPRPRMSR